MATWKFGWGLHPDARGKGYATEASAAVIHWVVQHAGVTSISATVPDDNYPSQRVAARLGLCRTFETRRYLPQRHTSAQKLSSPAENGADFGG